ncbi:MAG: hypothetical protein JWO82_1121 [Akkermansiaceae bacterium]|nr:hypothetical protein [Akkermansiaceae bacterium]
MGLYYGARLARNGEEVKFLLRTDFDAVRANGIQVESVAGDFHLGEVAAFRTSAEIGPVDLVIVAWKSTSNHLFESILPPLLHETTQILTLQNGLGNGELLAGLFGPQRVLGGLCFVCLNRLASGVVSHTAGGRIAVGEYRVDERGRAEEIARRLSAANIPCEAEDNLAAAQWKKLIWNIPFNGLAIAEGGVTTDVLLAADGIEDEIRALMTEVVATANQLGLKVDSKLIESNIERTRPMGPYRPSSMIDFVEGREVEYEAIWQEPLRRAQAAGVAVPHLEKLAARIQKRIAERDSKIGG